MANMQDPGDHDPFPKSGLVKRYEPFIRSEVSKFCKRYPNVRRRTCLLRPFALCRGRTAVQAELGNNCSTPLRHWLKELQRFAKSQEQRIPIYHARAST